MNRDENDEKESSEQQEGFFKPQLKVVLSSESAPPQAQRPEQFANEANDLVTYNRPTDFVPRVLSISPPIQYYVLQPSQQLIDLDLTVAHPAETLVTIQRQKIKRCKYPSLRDKYKSNHLYKLIYSKIDDNSDFNGNFLSITDSIISLNHTTDYNPNNYQQIVINQHSNEGKFQSRFQSGNLSYAYQSLESKIQEYDLILQNDTNTKGYNHWFYFSFRNESSKSVRFNIVNLVKKHSLFEQGVRPVGFSIKKSYKGWHSIGSKIDYQKTYVSRQISANPPIYKNYYTLSFTIDFQSENDVLYIALNYPYTYSRMMKFINGITENYPSIIIDRSVLAYTIANNALPVVRLKHPQYVEGGKKILIMGRQHPGQTVGSFVLQGFINSLVKQEKLLKSFEVILIPMVNPDGVIYGNFRTNLAGFDLNRQWSDPNRWMHPQIYYISKFISNLQNISFVIDFHGHSKKYNSFIYACTGQNPYLFRVFPYICGQQTDLFSMKDCTYSITPDKEKTARIKLYRQIKKPYVFTLQTSFFGYMDQNFKKYRYQVADLFQIGQKISESIIIHLTKKKELQQYEKEVKQKQYLFDQWSFQNKDDIDSQSNPSEDELTPFQRKQKVLSQRVKKNRTSKSKPKKKRSTKEEKKISITMIESCKPKEIATQRRNLISDHLLKPVPVAVEKPTEAVTKKKSQSVRLVHFNEVKVNKKIQKALAVISPPPPKQSVPNIISPSKPNQTKYSYTSSTFNLKTVEKAKQIDLISHPTNQDRKKLQELPPPPPPPAPIPPSNLFNTTNYYAQLHQHLKKQDKKSNLHQKTQSLQINHLKKQVIFPKGNNLNLLKRLISHEEDEEEQKSGVMDPNLTYTKQREHGFLIRQNRVINSLSKIHEDERNRNLEQQINNRTQALKNCQKKMRQMSLDEPILRKKSEMNLIETTSKLFYISSTTKTYKFPTIRMDKKLDYFNF